MPALAQRDVGPERHGVDPGPLLSVDLAGHSLGGRAILGPVALAVGAGETVAPTGPSGIGKTTLLRCIAGLEPRINGTIPAARVRLSRALRQGSSTGSWNTIPRKRRQRWPTAS